MIVNDDMENDLRYYNLDTRTNQPSKENKDDWKNTKGYSLTDKITLKKNTNIKNDNINDIIPEPIGSLFVMIELRFPDGYKIRRKYNSELSCEGIFNNFRFL